MGQELRDRLDYRSDPLVMIVADSEEGAGRANRAAMLAGCRVTGPVPIAEAPERLRQQASLEAMLVEADAGGANLDALLEAAVEAAAAGRFGSIFSIPLSMLDNIGNAAMHPQIEFLCDADDLDRVTAIALASHRPVPRLHDAGRDRQVPRLQQLSEEVARIARTLTALSDEEEVRDVVTLPLETASSGREPLSAAQVRAMIRARRLRDQYFPGDFFADPAWDMLLDLMAARLEGQKVAVSSLCIAAAVPPTTALRWIKTLTDAGLFERAADPQDGRRVYIELSDRAAAGLEHYLRAVQRLVPIAI